MKRNNIVGIIYIILSMILFVRTDINGVIGFLIMFMTMYIFNTSDDNERKD